MAGSNEISKALNPWLLWQKSFTKQKQKGWLMLVLATLQGNERHAPAKQGKNSEAPSTGERRFLKSRGAVLLAPHSPHPLPTSPISRLLINTAEPSSLTFQYSKPWTPASVSEAFQELRGKEELSQQLSVNSEEMPLISLHQKAIFRRTSRQGGEAPKMEIYRHLEAKVPQSKTSVTEKMLEKEFPLPGAMASLGPDRTPGATAWRPSKRGRVVI